MRRSTQWRVASPAEAVFPFPTSLAQPTWLPDGSGIIPIRPQGR